jgi:hypothetical protein
VKELGDAESRLLVATDCLSEGVNLQDRFDAVVHYDLSWNPTRHEQREGRVDRYGQRNKVVRATLLYGANNPVDGAVLQVILRKAAKIREELGVPVPLPDDGEKLTQVLLKAVLLRRRGGTPPDDKAQLDLFEKGWEDAREKIRRNRTVFAQRRLKPEEVLPEWKKALVAVGGRDEVRRFLDRGLARLGSGLEPLRRGFKAPLSPLPADVRERLELEGLSGTVFLDFDEPPGPRCRVVKRSDPLVSVLAETLLERTLAASTADGADDPAVLGRVGCWVSDGVARRTLVVLLRLRHQLVSQRGGRASTLLVEEASALAWSDGSTEPVEGGALALLVPAPVADPPSHVRELRSSRHSRAWRSLAEPRRARPARAQALLEDHRRVEAAARGSVSVSPLLPADVIGLWVLLPRVA